jgi:hypothetical protein
MANFDMKPEKKKTGRKGLIWNLLTVVMLLATACVGYYYLNIFNDPHSLFNPFPPQVMPTLFETITSTITPIQLEPTWTYTPSLVPSPTRTRAATWTPLPEMITPTITDTPTDTLVPSPSATPTLASVSITYEASTVVHPDSACKWLGVGGQVLDKDSKPLAYQTIQMGGALNGANVTHYTLSGTTLKALYGDAGYEIVLSDKPVDSTGTLWVQLFDNTSKPLTDKIYFNTYSDCTKNLVLIVFTKLK